MRGRKEWLTEKVDQCGYIKKESPNEGTETRLAIFYVCLGCTVIKKESPNEGTETIEYFRLIVVKIIGIKKESPNEGTETPKSIVSFRGHCFYKKRIPE